MRKQWFKVALLWFTVLSSFSALMLPGFAGADIGANGGKTTLKSDIEMMYGIPVHGGGHFTWTVTGEAASELRAAIIVLYDVNPKNNQLEKGEVDQYLLHLERYLEQRDAPEGETLRYQGANLRSFALLNRNSQVDTSGLIGASNSTQAEIEIRFYFDAWMNTGSANIKMSDTLLADAIYQPLNETYRGSYRIDHTEYMIGIGSYSDIKIEDGFFFMFRTPFGDVFFYNVEFKAGENPNEKVRYDDFNFIECPLILFIVVVILGYFTVTMPGRYRRYDVAKIKKLHTMAKLLLVILLVLYFIGGFGSIFFSGIYLWILGFIFMFVSMVVSKSIYENAARITTMPEKPEIEPEAPGEVPGEPPAPAAGPGGMVQCATCGEIFQMADYDTLSSALCPICGSIGAIEMEGPKGKPLPPGPVGATPGTGLPPGAPPPEPAIPPDIEPEPQPPPTAYPPTTPRPIAPSERPPQQPAQPPPQTQPAREPPPPQPATPEPSPQPVKRVRRVVSPEEEEDSQ